MQAACFCSDFWQSAYPGVTQEALEAMQAHFSPHALLLQ